MELTKENIERIINKYNPSEAAEMIARFAFINSEVNKRKINQNDIIILNKDIEGFQKGTKGVVMYAFSSGKTFEVEFNANERTYSLAVDIDDVDKYIPESNRVNELLEAAKLIDVLYGDRSDYVEPYKNAWDKFKAAIAIFNKNN